MSGPDTAAAAHPAADSAVGPVDTASAIADATTARDGDTPGTDSESGTGGAGPSDRGIRRRVTSLYRRFEGPIQELWKFGTVGALCYVIDFTVFNGLRMIDVEPLLSATTSMIVAASVGFIGNRNWTWRDRERSGVRREYSLYIAFNAAGLLIALMILAISFYGLGALHPAFRTLIAENVAKNVIGTGVGATFRFWAYRTIVFRTVR